MGQNCARLDSDRCQALMDKALLHDFVRFFECPGQISLLLLRVKGNVIRPLGMDNRRACGESLLGIRDNRQRLIIDLNQIERVTSCVAICGDYGCDSFPDITDFVHCEYVVFRNSERVIAAANRESADLIFDF